MSIRRIVIIGAGATGTAATRALRASGFDGALALIDGEGETPYERPALSKSVLTDAADPPVLLDAATIAREAIDLVSGIPAAAIDRAARCVTLANGPAISYDRLLIATGATPRRLTLPGAERVYYLRNLADARAIRTRLVPGAAIAIVGGGLIGLELAASARRLGCAVTVIEAAPRILGRAVPARLAAAIEARHRASGVAFHTSATIASIDGAGLRLDNDAWIGADAVIAGIGVVPETALAGAAGLALDNGIAVDAAFATSDSAIFAAGDCCALPHRLFGTARLRFESWRVAGDTGACVAATLLGVARPFDAVPWFWSDQYDETLQIAGMPQFGARIVERATGTAAPMLFHLAADGRLVAAAAFGPAGAIGRDIRIAERLIAACAHPAPEDLADPSRPLKVLLRGTVAA
ncbi:FAD-dependent oxidoreductase [Acidiphilium sp. AL]|uniref:FAD-dependent oxidoreductase n=1 Tax=Acidiphilium iwatense TaxID=768198 RepID=A0ABS9DZD3_9PROT|nr:MULTISPECIES: FAD-dependent oxidoreductase [Acidiphilium]MCF3948124.1 FAD-dependent oxidoreductase [Acidiphilium iwatense]MCU4161511.1 FAD-dependent oxidoreductase [Acidiphilium sp. AL]